MQNVQKKFIFPKNLLKTGFVTNDKWRQPTVFHLLHHILLLERLRIDFLYYAAFLDTHLYQGSCTGSSNIVFKICDIILF